MRVTIPALLSPLSRLRACRFDRLPQRAARLAAAGGVLVAVPVAATAATHRPVETITFVAPDYSDKTQGYWKSVIRRFERAQPGIAVDLQMVHWTDINQKVGTLVLTGHVPDVLNLDSYANFAGDGSLLPASEVLSQKTRSDFVPVFARNGRVRGVQYGIPMAGS